MRDNVGLNNRQAKFVALVAAGEHSVSACYVLAGYGTKPDSANAAKLRKSLDSFIHAERERLGFAPLGEEQQSDVDDADMAELVAAQRKLYAAAVADENLAVQRAALRSLERLLKPKRAPGRPAASTTAKTAPARPPSMFEHMSSEQVWELAFSIVETDEDRAAHEAHTALWADYERERALAINNLPNKFNETPFPGAKTRVLPGGTQVIDFAEPAAADLKSSASPIALEQAETVKRL